MSKKRREKVEATSELTTLNLNNTASESKGFDKSGWLAKLKNHWWAVALIGLLSLGTFGAGMKYLEESAKQEKTANGNRLTATKDQSLLSKINPFVEPPLPTATPQLSKEYIYNGSRMLAVEDANASAAPPSDLAVWRPSTGFWYVLGGTTGSQPTAFQWGGAEGDKTVPGDYDGDGKTDFSIFRPSNGIWYVMRSSDGSDFAYAFGQAGDKPAPADYDGDGKTDAAVFRSGTWYLQRSSEGFLGVVFGGADAIPIPADYDGDGKADLAVRGATDGRFRISPSSNPANHQVIHFGNPDDVPVVGDYDGDGKADIAVWQGDGVNQWHARLSATQTLQSTSLGAPETDIAVQNDYDGDGKVDMAIWRPANGTWYIQKSSGGTRTEQWGMSGDFPVPAFYRR